MRAWSWSLVAAPTRGACNLRHVHNAERERVKGDTGRQGEAYLEQLARVGRELPGTARGILDAAPRLACGVLGAEGSTLLALRGAEPIVLVRHGEAVPLPRAAVEAVQRGLDPDGGGRPYVVADHGRSALAVVPLGAQEERWALVVALGGGPRPGGEAHAIEVLAALLDASLCRARAAEGEGARSARSGAGRRARITFDDLLGEDPAFRACVAKARRAALADVPLLITGERGTGKERMAQAIHNASARAAEPMVAINCAAIPRSCSRASSSATSAARSRAR